MGWSRVRSRDQPGCAAARPKRSPKPSKSPQVTYTPTQRKATSLTTDSTATAVMSPVWCLVKSRLRAPNRMPNKASVPATSTVGSKISSTDDSRMIMREGHRHRLELQRDVGNHPPTTSSATSMPSGADLP